MRCARTFLSHSSPDIDSAKTESSYFIKYFENLLYAHVNRAK